MAMIIDTPALAEVLARVGVETFLRELAGRTAAADLTVSDSVGFALEDYLALRYGYDRARSLGLGRELPLVPAPKDPKDLFGYVAGLVH